MAVIFDTLPLWPDLHSNSFQPQGISRQDGVKMHSALRRRGRQHLTLDALTEGSQPAIRSVTRRVGPTGDKVGQVAPSGASGQSDPLVDRQPSRSGGSSFLSRATRQCMGGTELCADTSYLAGHSAKRAPSPRTVTPDKIMATASGCVIASEALDIAWRRGDCAPGSPSPRRDRRPAAENSSGPPRPRPRAFARRPGRPA